MDEHARCLGEMVTFLNLMMTEPDIARLVMLDSSKWNVIEAGLNACRKTINSISLKEGEETFVEQARIVRRFSCRRYGFDEKGQADNYERRIEICERAYKILTEK